MSASKKKKSKTLWVWILLPVALIALLAALICTQPDMLADLFPMAIQPADTEAPEAGMQTPYVSPTPRATLQIDPNAGALITPTPKPTAPGVAIPGWGRIRVPAGVTEVKTDIPNPEANEGWYYLTFELRMKETGEVLFTTGLIPPGQYCNQVTLTRPLEKGEYEVILHVQPYRMSDQSPTNNADLETMLYVE